MLNEDTPVVEEVTTRHYAIIGASVITLIAAPSAAFWMLRKRREAKLQQAFDDGVAVSSGTASIE